ncbi:MAG: glycosyltransferase family 39 protein [Chloracidobacterium sp.]|nr:glycosyltransferase family 39 protein [Chloracidobacterium sp.]
MKPELTQRSQLIILGLLMLLHLAIAVPFAYHLNIWVDEASTLYATQNGLAVAIQTAAAQQKQAPLYFWVMSVWRLASDSIFFARLFSIICSLGAISVFASLAKRYFQPKPALLLTAFFALHPYLIWASVEIRVYSAVILLSVVLLRLFLDAFPAPENNDAAGPFARTKLLFLAIVIVALYTNFYLGFVIAGLFVALIVSRRWRDARSFALLMIIAGIVFIPMVLMVKSVFLAKTSGYQEEHSLIVPFKEIWYHSLTFVLPAEVFPAEPPSIFAYWRTWVVRVAFIVLGAFAVVRRRQITADTLQVGTITSVILVCLVIAYFLIGHEYLAIRHLAPLFAPIILLLALLCRDILKDSIRIRPAIPTLVFCVVVMTSFTYATINLYPGYTKRGDWARVGEFIRQNEKPGQPIIVFITFESLALRYHYAGINRILPSERFFVYGPEGKYGSPESLKSEIDYVIFAIPADAEQIWLAVGEKCIVTEACTPLQKYIDAHYTIEIEQQFYLEKVYLLKKKPQ